MRVATLFILLLSFGCLKDSAPPPVASSPGYTGAVVHCSPNCNPCAQLKSDVQWLIDEHGWSASQWQFKADEAVGAKVPRVEFFKAGKVVDTVHGYSIAAWPERKSLLLDLIKRHPEH